MAFIESGKTFDKEENYKKMKNKMENLEFSTYLVRIPTHLYKKIKLKLVQEDKKLQPVLLKMLEEYINKS